MTLDELTDLAFFLFAPDSADYDRYAVRRAQFRKETISLININLDEVAAELDKLERGTYTTAVSAAELVRRMKVK
jgi:hypothetical protein